EPCRKSEKPVSALNAPNLYSLYFFTASASYCGGIVSARTCGVITRICASASAIDTPGFSRATLESHHARRSIMRGCAPFTSIAAETQIGTATSYDSPTETPVNFGGVTPM